MELKSGCLSVLVILSLLLLLPLNAAAAPVTLAPGEIMELQSGDTIDLDNDGAPDTITIDYVEDADGYMADYTLTINDQSAKGEYSITVGGLWALRTIASREALVMVYDLGPSDDPLLECYLYQDGQLHYAGYIPAPPTSITQSTGLITGMVRGEILHTWYHPADFMISHNYGYMEATDTLTDTPLIVHVPRPSYPMGSQVTLGRDITLLINPFYGAETAISLEKGDKVVLAASDDLRWVYIKSLELEKYDGLDSPYRSGWLDIGNNTWEGIPVYGEMVPAAELFQGLLFSD